jgi:hypothetical protein
VSSGSRRGWFAHAVVRHGAIALTSVGFTFAVACNSSNGGQPVECTDGDVQEISASNYDQSCKTDSDCVAVGVGNACYACVLGCPVSAINVHAKAQYMMDVQKTSGWAALNAPNFTACGCPSEGPPCCMNGTCGMGCFASPSNDASADATSD